VHWEWNEKTEIGTGLAGFGTLLVASRRGTLPTLLGAGMLAGGGYLVYDGLAEEKAPPPKELTKPTVQVEIGG